MFTLFFLGSLSYSEFSSLSRPSSESWSRAICRALWSSRASPCPPLPLRSMSANSELGILDGSGNKRETYRRRVGLSWERQVLKKAPLVRIQCASLLLVSKQVIIINQCNPEAWNTRLFPETGKPAVAIFPFRVRTPPLQLVSVRCLTRCSQTRHYRRICAHDVTPSFWWGRDGAELGCDLHAPRWLDGSRTETEFSHSSARPALFFSGLIKKQHNTFYVHYSYCLTFSFSWCFTQTSVVKTCVNKELLVYITVFFLLQL